MVKYSSTGWDEHARCAFCDPARSPRVYSEGGKVMLKRTMENLRGEDSAFAVAMGRLPAACMKEIADAAWGSPCPVTPRGAHPMAVLTVYPWTDEWHTVFYPFRLGDAQC